MSARSDSLFHIDAPRVARAALLGPVNSLFDYVVREALSSDEREGCRMRVPIKTRRVADVIATLRAQSR